MFGFYRIAAIVPVVELGNPTANCQKISMLCNSAENCGASIAVFPELTITGSSCGDLFFLPDFLKKTEEEIKNLLTRLPNNLITVIGAPIQHHHRIFNAALIIQNQKIIGIVPQSSPNDSRHFAGINYNEKSEVNFAGQSNIPFSNSLIFDAGNGLIFAVEIGNDAKKPISPVRKAAANGAVLLLHPTAEHEFAGSAEQRKKQVLAQSSNLIAAYVSVSSGFGESTTDYVFGGYSIAGENGELRLDSPRFLREDNLCTFDIDIEYLHYARSLMPAFYDDEKNTEFISMFTAKQSDNYSNNLSTKPFSALTEDERDKQAKEILDIQCAGLIRRLHHTNLKKIILGISGGLDSTLALLVSARALRSLNLPARNLIAITMPGFGTTDRTYQNAIGLCKSISCQLRELPIKQACTEHFSLIGHDINEHNLVFENTQARERTQIILDLANKESALAVGTGDLSEIALGWCTYNGDHISMYGINSTIPKSIIPEIINKAGRELNDNAMSYLLDIINTPVSPELLPADSSGQIAQKTEDIIGPYELHDFFLYHFLIRGAGKNKLRFLAKKVFNKFLSDEKIDEYLNLFFKRFVTQQFKRSCMPDGPQAEKISLSPRGGLMLPSDLKFDFFKNN